MTKSWLESRLVEEREREREREREKLFETFETVKNT